MIQHDLPLQYTPHVNRGLLIGWSALVTVISTDYTGLWLIEDTDYLKVVVNCQ